MDRQPHTNYEAFSDGRSEADPEELPSTSYSHAELELPSLPRHRGLRWVYSKVFRKSSELDDASVNHQYTRAERERLSNVESIDYLPPNSAVFRKWLASQPHGYKIATPTCSTPYLNYGYSDKDHSCSWLRSNIMSDSFLPAPSSYMVLACNHSFGVSRCAQHLNPKP